MTRAVVVGGGLFGSIISRELRRQGADVMTIDAGRENAGSKPAACLMKPNWFSGLGKAITEPALELLDRNYGLQDITFHAGTKLLPATVHWVPPSLVLAEEVHRDRVTSVGEDHVVTERRGRVEAELIVVANGVWASELIDVPGLKGRSGSAFLWPNARIKQPFIHPWAPYKQVVAFNRGDGLWVGDGRSIKPDNWTTEHSLESRGRCSGRVGMEPTAASELHGIRPYVADAKPAYLRQPSRRVWVATGGAKNGTLAAAWCAHEIARNAL